MIMKQKIVRKEIYNEALAKAQKDSPGSVNAIPG